MSRLVGLSIALTRMPVSSTPLGMTPATHHPDLFGDLFFLFPDFLWSTPLHLRVEAPHARKEPLQSNPRPLFVRRMRSRADVFLLNLKTGAHKLPLSLLGPGLRSLQQFLQFVCHNNIILHSATSWIPLRAAQRHVGRHGVGHVRW
jgi:hypothetical protein